MSNDALAAVHRDKPDVKSERGQITSSDITVCPMTSTGAAVGAAAAGRKYWQDKELNAAR